MFLFTLHSVCRKNVNKVTLPDKFTSIIIYPKYSRIILPMPINTLFFDLDDTLYPASTGLWNAIRDRMNAYIGNLVDLPPGEIVALRQHYLETYGTTLRGLQIHYQIDADEYLAYVHDLPLKKYIQPDPCLGTLLHSLPQRRWIFTNADIHHARRILSILQLEGCFEGIIDIRALNFICKPDPVAYVRALEVAGISNPAECVLFDDAPRNLQPALDRGWIPVWVGGEQSNPAAFLTIPNLHALPQAMPELWDQSS
jgi:putative hydrolase of the HAD superfamily